MGKGGVKEALGERYNGDSHMEITSQTYWYVKTYLANKIAFQEACEGSPQMKIGLLEAKGKRKLSEIANEVSIDEPTLKEYNKWAKSGIIPDDKPYHVAIPGGTIPQDFNVLVLKSPKPLETIATTSVKGDPIADVKFHINGVLVIKALHGETVSAISKRSGVDVSNFIRFNDIPIDARIIPGEYYYVKHKKRRSSHNLYQAKPGDNLWMISQQQGIQLKYLKKYNPTIGDQLLNANTMVRLNKNKSIAPIPLENDLEVAELANESFAWSIQPNQSKVTQIAPAEAEPINVQKQTAVKVSFDSVTVAQNPILAEGGKSNIVVYEVKSSDTLYGIARQFGVTIKDVMDWNNKSSLTINPGEKLKIIKR
jgi:membrane-bound lytic murein transglycosylase D